eukprot:2438913-Lingulodinium_polyedra.AAC.1
MVVTTSVVEPCAAATPGTASAVGVGAGVAAGTAPAPPTETLSWASTPVPGRPASTSRIPDG